MQSLVPTAADPWLHLRLVFGASLTALLVLGRLWRAAWARIERCAPSHGVCWRGTRDAARRALILACVFVISAALTFAR